MHTFKPTLRCDYNEILNFNNDLLLKYLKIFSFKIQIEKKRGQNIVFFVFKSYSGGIWSSRMK